MAAVESSGSEDSSADEQDSSSSQCEVVPGRPWPCVVCARRRPLLCVLVIAVLAALAIAVAVAVWWLERRDPYADPRVRELYTGIAEYVRTHLANVTNDWDDTRCRADEAKPFSETPCNNTRFTNVTGYPVRSSRNVAFCLASAFGAPDSEGDPPQCRWDDTNDISEEMGWADAAVFNPTWSDDCASLKGPGHGFWDYCDCLEESNSVWWEAYKSNLLKYCSNKFLIVLTKKNGNIGFSQRCEIRWILRHAISPLSCPIIPWNFDQLWEFRSMICKKRQGLLAALQLHGLFHDAARQIEPLVSYQFNETAMSPDFHRYMEYLATERVSCWET